MFSYFKKLWQARRFDKHKNIAQKQVVVLGMHKSGTSMIAWILQELSVDMGQDMLGADNNNVYGHYEDMDFLKLNHKMLQDVGGDWFDPPIRKLLLRSAKNSEEDIKALIAKKQDLNDVWGWKDPRTTLLIDAYLPHLSNPIIIACKRNIDDIAKSLQKRDGMAYDEAFTLAEEYVYRLDAFIALWPESKQRVLELTYEGILAEPRGAVRRIVKHLGIRVTSQQINSAVNTIKPRETVKLDQEKSNE